MGRRLAILAAAAATLTAPAAAQAQLAGYDGANPFDCVLQQAGFGTDYDDPAADPFCVEYDKTRQNVAPDLGLVEFLSKEPARVAAASDKCFYYQHDHWRGSIVQDDDRTETYSWDGRYYFDKAQGRGGVYVENFTFNNQTGDPTQLPGFPEEYKPFFGPGRGGVQGGLGVRADPRCVEQVRNAPPPGPYRCQDRSGSVGRGIGGIRPGMTRSQAIEALGPPPREARGFLRFCLVQGGKLAAGFPRGASAPMEFLLTTSPRFDLAGVRVGDRERAARERLRDERTLSRRRGSTVLALRERGLLRLVGVRAGRVVYLAVARADLSAREVDSYLTRSR